MKKGIFLLLLIVIYSCNSLVKTSTSQDNDSNICVIYKFTPASVKQDKAKKEETEYLASIFNENYNIELELVFNKNKSVFKLIDKVDLEEDRNYQLISGLANRGKVYYNDAEKNIFFTKSLITDSPYYVKENNNNDKWVLTDETKRIDNYLCYKAFFNQTSITRRGEERTLKVVAWYSPELPYSFGPMGLNRLPGLILEASLNGGKSIYYAKSIDFKSDKKLDFVEPEKLITREEYNQLYQKLRENQE